MVSKRLFTYADGLPGREVTCAIQDKNGYMWFGTRNGLCRFDGKKFQVFTKKSAGLAVNHIRQLIFDNNHGIIILYQPKVNEPIDATSITDVIDINTLKVKSFDRYYKKCPFKQDQISTINYSKSNKSVLIYLKPFFYLDLFYYPKAVSWELSESGSFTKVHHKIVKTITFETKKNKDYPIIAPYSSSTDLLKQALLVYNDETAVVSGTFPWVFINYSTPFGFIVQHLDLSLHHYYYYVSYLGKVIPIGNGSATFKGISFVPNFTYYQAPTDSLLFRLEKNNSLRLCNRSFGDISIIDSTDSDVLKKARILSITLDQLGNRWFCTTEGVLKLSIKKKKFKSYFSLKDVPFGINHSARGMLKYKDQLFASLYDFVGIKKNNQFDSLTIHANFSLLKSGNTIWLGGFQLRSYDLTTQKTTYRNQFETAEIWSMFQFNNHHLLLGGTYNIFSYNTATNDAKPLKNKLKVVPSLVYRFFYNSQKELLAVADNGIFVINKNGKIVDCYSHEATSTNKRLPFSNINDLYQDKNGTYWFATAFDGLYKWDKKQHHFESFGIDDGFLSETMYRIEEDPLGKLWISTDFGLAKFDKTTQRATIYTEVDGIAHNEFNRGSSYKDDQGNLYFGGVDGITCFNPMAFKNDENDSDFPFHLNTISRYNSKTNLLEAETALIDSIKKIDLSDDKRSLTLSFTLLDLEERDHLYAYKIEGYNNEWNYTREGSLSISNLPYGDYTIRIKAQCANGLWNKTEIVLPLAVVMPFYKTGWFITLLILSVVAVAFLAIKYRINNLKNRNLKLEEKVEIRTAELKSSLDEQTVLLQEVHHRVKNNLQFIAAMLKMQINSIKDESNQKVLIETSRRINSMSLVHEMLYHKDKLESISIKEYLNELVTKLNELIYTQQTPVEFTIHCKDLRFDLNNCVAIGMITSEVISNAIKHAFSATNNPQISISLVHKKQDKMIIYSIEDNGVETNTPSTESGLGMRLIDIFSRQMEAEYELVKTNNGWKYSFNIPYTN